MKSDWDYFFHHVTSLFQNPTGILYEYDSMFLLTIARDYLIWHYSTALVSFLRIYKNFWWFLTQFFSLPQLLSSLFNPYKRIKEPRGSLLDIEGWMGYLIINVLSRLIGLFTRLAIISWGIVSLAGLSFLGALCYAFFIIAPFLIVICFVYGIYLLF